MFVLGDYFFCSWSLLRTCFSLWGTDLLQCLGRSRSIFNYCYFPVFLSFSFFFHLFVLHYTRHAPFLAWGDFHARSRFAHSTIPEEKWGTTRSLAIQRQKKVFYCLNIAFLEKYCYFVVYKQFICKRYVSQCIRRNKKNRMAGLFSSRWLDQVLAWSCSYFYKSLRIYKELRKAIFGIINLGGFWPTQLLQNWY